MNFKNIKNLTKTKLLATAGPTFEGYESMKELIINGVNVVRLNTSHGDQAEHGSRIKDVKQIRKDLGVPISLLLDTKGPEIRTGNFEGDTVVIKKDTNVILTTRDVLGNDKLIPVSYKELPQTVSEGQRVVIDDGKLLLNVVKVINETDVEVVTLNEHKIAGYRGVNIPGAILKLPFISDYDKENII
jgi:pyruvate kinase